LQKRKKTIEILQAENPHSKKVIQAIFLLLLSASGKQGNGKEENERK
jgi:hypothetical protein